MEDALRVAGVLDVAVLVPVEDGPRVVVGAGNESVEGDGSEGDDPGHGQLARTYSAYDLRILFTLGSATAMQ
jgi:hypothetical protein